MHYDHYVRFSLSFGEKLPSKIVAFLIGVGCLVSEWIMITWCT